MTTHPDADLLREAARAMRSRSRFGAAGEVADWLEHEAEQFEKFKHMSTTVCWWERGPVAEGALVNGFYTASTCHAWQKLHKVEVIPPTPDARALAVARAYLASQAVGQ